MAKTRRTTRTTRTTRASRKPAARAFAPARVLQTLRNRATKAVQASTRTLVERAQDARDLVAARAEEAREAVTTRVGAARQRTRKAVNQLEHVFEQRVSQAVAKLGVPSARDVRALGRQVAELQATVEQLRRSRARAH